MPEPSLSFVTCVSERARYDAFVAASLPAAVELLPIDNTGNALSAAAALNLGWSRARARLVVLCHQDVVFPHGWTDRLLDQLDEVACRSPAWGVAGVFGRRGREYLGHVDDRYGIRRLGDLPARVETLDECCLVVRRELPLRFDESLTGYHLYGVDLCLQALAAGMANWALDCPVKHLGEGRKEAAYYAQRHVLEGKWRRRRLRVGVIGRIPAKMWGPSGPLHFGLRHMITRPTVERHR